MSLILTQTPVNKPSLKDWFNKHNVSGNITSSGVAIKRAIEHEQLKYELKNLIDHPSKCTG